MYKRQNSDGTITASEAIDFVRTNFRHLSGRTQTPTLEGSADLVLSQGKLASIDIVPLLRDGAPHASERGRFLIETGEGLRFYTIPGWELPEYTYRNALFHTTEPNGGVQFRINAIDSDCRGIEPELKDCWSSVKDFQFRQFGTQVQIGAHKGHYGTYYVPLEGKYREYEAFVFEGADNTRWRFQMMADREFSEHERKLFKAFIADAEVVR